MNMRLHVVVRTLAICLAGLPALAAGLLYVSQFRAGLIDTRVQSLIVQGEIVVNAIAVSIAPENNAMRRGGCLGGSAGPTLSRCPRCAAALNRGGEIGQMVEAERLALFRVFLIAVSVVAVHLLLF